MKQKVFKHIVLPIDGKLDLLDKSAVLTTVMYCVGCLVLERLGLDYQGPTILDLFWVWHGGH